LSRIKIPDVPGNLEYEGPWSPNEGLQTRQMLHSTLMNISQYEDEIIDELGMVTLTILPTNRVLVTSENGSQQVVAYMADPHVDGRIVLDDYVPEIPE
jgi:hypothetical protein